MEKTDFTKPEVTVQAATVPVMPRTLMIRPMEYKHPAGVSVFFAGVFGNDADSKEAGDVWVATFVDRDEAESFILASKTVGQMIMGMRLAQELKKPEGSSDAVRVQDGGESTAATN